LLLPLKQGSYCEDEKGNEMDNKILIKNKMNEILRGDTDMLARKYIGRSADTMNSKDKDKALADIYMAFNDELKKSKEVKSDVALRREQIDNEMKDIRNRDRDELLSQRIRNYDPSISIKEKDAILGKIYDGLQNERKKLDKSSGKTTTLKPEIEFLPDRIGKLEITTLPGTVEEPEIITLPGTVEEPEIIPMPYRPGTAELMPLPYKPGTAKAEPLPYRPGQANGYTNYPYYFNEEKTKGKTLLEDALRGTGVKNTNEPSVKMLSNRSDIQPVKYSATSSQGRRNPRTNTSKQDETDRINRELDNSIAYIQSLEKPTQDEMSDAYFRQQVFNSTDRDTFLENHQEMYGYYYNDNMSEAEKNDLYRYVKSCVEEESNAAQSNAKGLWDANDAIKWIEKNVYDVQNGNADINFTYNTLLEQQAYAWANYANTGSQYALEVAYMWDLAEEKFLNDNDVGQGNFFTNTLMSKLPGKINEVKAGAKTGLVGAGVGGVLGGTPGAFTGWSKGYDIGTTLNDFNKNTGIACKALVDAGIEASLAVKGAKIIASLGAGVGAIFETICSSLGDDEIKDEAIEKIVEVYAEAFGDKVGEYVQDKLTQTYIGKHS